MLIFQGVKCKGIFFTFRFWQMMLVTQLLGIVVPPSVTETCVTTSKCGVCFCVCVCVCLFSFSEGVNFD